MAPKRIYIILLFILLFFISLFKDHFTPEYRNSYNVTFLDRNSPQYESIWASHVSHTAFWIQSYFYSMLFLIVPYLIIRLQLDAAIARFCLYGFILAFIAEYAIVYSQIPILVDQVLTKINRIYHSPFLTLFVVAAFTLNKRKSDGPR